MNRRYVREFDFKDNTSQPIFFDGQINNNLNDNISFPTFLVSDRPKQECKPKDDILNNDFLKNLSLDIEDLILLGVLIILLMEPEKDMTMIITLGFIFLNKYI